MSTRGADFRMQLNALIDDCLAGRITRREAVRKAGMLGISAPVTAMLLRTSTPPPDPACADADGGERG